MEKNNYLNELKVGLEAFDTASKIIQIYYGRDFSIDYKRDGSPVTEADKAANDVITQIITNNFSSDGIVSEESKNIQGTKRTWYIDPIDGTKQFVSHSDQVAVHIGMCVGTEPVLGIVGKPLTGEIYIGVKGEGAYRTNIDGTTTNLQIKNIRNENELVATTGLEWHDKAYTSNMLEKLAGSRVIRTGSQGLRMVKFAENIVDMWFPDGKYKSKTNTWDICAPQVIVQEAGGYVTYKDGNKINYTGQRKFEEHLIAASSKQTLDKLIAELN